MGQSKESTHSGSASQVGPPCILIVKENNESFSWLSAKINNITT